MSMCLNYIEVFKLLLPYKLLALQFKFIRMQPSTKVKPIHFELNAPSTETHSLL